MTDRDEDLGMNAMKEDTVAMGVSEESADDQPLEQIYKYSDT